MTTRRWFLLRQIALAIVVQLCELSMAQEPRPQLRSIAFQEERPKSTNTHLDGRGGSFFAPSEDRTLFDEKMNPVVLGRLLGYRIRKTGDDERNYYFGAAYTLREGEIIAFVGYLYRVGRCKHLYAPITWIPEMELPEGLAPIKPDSFAIPLKRFGHGGASFWDEGITVTEIAPPKDPKKDKYKATLSLHTQMRFATVQTGDFVLLTKHVDTCHAFEVRNIVPEDPKLKTAGWVEFAPSFLPEADLIRDKKPYVRPIPIGQKASGLNGRD